MLELLKDMTPLWGIAMTGAFFSVSVEISNIQFNSLDSDHSIFST